VSQLVNDTGHLGYPTPVEVNSGGGELRLSWGLVVDPAGTSGVSSSVPVGE
jgi:hypothetical protein